MSGHRARLGPGAVAVVTGAAGGLGQALSRALEGHGVKVVRTDVRGAPGVDRVLDVTDPAALRELAAELVPQVWVNNAGILGAADALGQSDEEIRRVVEVNLLGVVHGSRAAAGVMVDRGGGVILNIGSLAAWNPTPGLAIYSATKHAVRAYSGALAAELAGTGVRVQCLCPDGIWTPMLQSAVGLDSAAMPFSGRRLLEPGEVADEAMRLLAGRRLVRSLPPGRAVLAKLSGLWPALGVASRNATERQGRRHQARYRERLDAEERAGR
ncbi:MAG: SDR family NAD(P)-dependent oxidoreductase [Actinomycetota bacterium]|nr:SDR family NAD(P)-dependent oxidoreductase [Actinomycetota bacterium]